MYKGISPVVFSLYYSDSETLIPRLTLLIRVEAENLIVFYTRAPPRGDENPMCTYKYVTLHKHNAMLMGYI